MDDCDQWHVQSEPAVRDVLVPNAARLVLFSNHNCMLTVRCSYWRHVVGVAIHYLCHKRESVLVMSPSFWCRKGRGSRDSLGYVHFIRHARHLHLYSIMESPKFQEVNWLVQDHSIRSLLVGGNKDERKKITLPYCHPYWLFSPGRARGHTHQ